MRALTLGVLGLLLLACSSTPTRARNRPGGSGGEGGEGGSGGAIDEPDAGPPPLKARGASCTAGSQCRDGVCADGFCCESACTGPCQSCKLPGSEGRCTAVPDGTDPDSDCADDGASTCKRDGMCDGAGACRKYPATTECMPGSCTGSTEASARLCDGNGTCQVGTTMSCPTACVAGACNRTCSDVNPCQTGFFCDTTGMCKLKVALGQVCATNAECSTGACADGVCCQTACNQLCYSCKVPGSVGTCLPAADGEDPKNECAAQTPSTCGHAGGCNGAGACRLHPAGTACGTQTCAGATQKGARTCNGAGSCLEGDVTDCNPFRCGGTSCRTTCRNNTDCALGFLCMAGNCTGDGQAGLVLHWRFDETSGTVAVDTAGNNHAGTYVGVTGTPTSSALVARIGGDNLRSRAFLRSGRQAVQLQNTPADLQPQSELTVAAWYRATSVDTSGAVLVSAGNNYVIRLRPTQIELGKRTTSAQGTIRLAQVLATVPSMLNGAWHHVAGVTSATDGM
jgi:hypothetical protein